MQLHFMASVQKGEKQEKSEKMSNFLKACISGMAGMICFKSGT